MNKILFATALLSVFLLSIVNVAAIVQIDCSPEYTTIGGRVYMAGDMFDGVPGAEVIVDCSGILKNTTTDALGDYKVLYSPTDTSTCHYGSNVMVTATAPGLSGDSDGIISWNQTQSPCLELDIGVANVPMVPEFTLIIGLTTIIGAVAVFFVIRRK